MELNVEAVTKESKQAQGKTYWGVKSGDQWFNLVMDQKPSRGATLNVDIKETQFNGRTYKWATPALIAVKETTLVPPNGNGAAPTSNGHAGPMEWEDFEATVKAAAAMIREFEPDNVVPEGDAQVTVTVDRSAARASILCTIIISLTNGKIGPALPF